jgi:hypothetical protein
MKKTIYIIAALAFVILTACPTESTSSSNNPYFGDNLELSGDVRIRDISALPFITYTSFNETGVISDGGLGGSGKIERGKLSYSIGEPAAEALRPIATLFSAMDPDLANYVDMDAVDIQPLNANVALLSLAIADNDNPRLLTRERITPPGLTSLNITSEMVTYIYVDRKVTITVQEFERNEVIMDIPVSLTSPTINLELKKGWNAVDSTLVILLTMDLESFDIDNPELKADGNLDIKLGNPPSLYWVVGSSDDGSLPFYQYRFLKTGR